MRSVIKSSIRVLILFFITLVVLDKTLVLSWPVLLFLVIATFIIAKPYLPFVLELAIGADQFFSKLLRPIDKLTDRFLTRESPLPNAKYYRFAILGIVSAGAVTVIVSSLVSGFTFRDIGDIIFDSTFFSHAVDLMENIAHFGSVIKANFTLIAVINLGVSSFLSFLYMRCTLETVREFTQNRVAKFLLVLLLNLAFIVISGILTEHIQTLCLCVADGTQNMISFMENLYHSGIGSLWDVPIAFICVLLFLILCPVTLFLLVLTAREVVATILYGAFAYLLFLSFLVFHLLIIACLPNAPEWFLSICYSSTNILIPIVAFVPDYIRSTESLKQRLFIYAHQKSNSHL